MITLKAITEDNFMECVDLQVHDEQKGFVASNVFSLAQAWLYHDIARPMAIYDGDTMVGFVMMHCDAAETTCGVWRFMIGKQYQNKGYGKAAMTIVLDYLKQHKSFTKARLSFEPENTVARKLYESFGFAPTGEIDEGEIVMVLDLA